MTQDKVFIIGGTGNIGSLVVQKLLAKGISTTVYARNPAKVTVKHELLTIVQGDYNNDSGLATLKDTIKGHTRLFLLVTFGAVAMPVVKKSIAEIAYAAGVKQIVDISSLAVSAGGRRSFIGLLHEESEETIYKLKDDYNAYYVALRPGIFMINALHRDVTTLSDNDAILDIVDANVPNGWVSTSDIADVAVKVFQDPVEKHFNIVYEIVSDSITGAERAAVYSKVLGRPIAFRKIDPEEKYKYTMEHMHLPHLVAYDLASDFFKNFHEATPAISILLGRKPESFEQWVLKNKGLFLKQQ